MRRRVVVQHRLRVPRKTCHFSNSSRAQGRCSVPRPQIALLLPHMRPISHDVSLFGGGAFLIMHRITWER